MNHLYYGDNLRVLRESIAEASVDLIYLDPPFNSNASYNVLFKGPQGNDSAAQIEAFDDTWHWGETSEQAFQEVLRAPNTDAGEMLRAMRSFLGDNDMMAYLAMMAVRLIELHRVLKPTGSLYLHCDPTASHYLKILLDAVFGARMFRNEIIWKRSDAHNDGKQGAKQFGRIHDIIFFYSKSNEWGFNTLYEPLPQRTVDSWYRNIETETGRRYNKADLTAAKGGGDTEYEWKGVRPPTGRYWAYSKENMQKMEADGRLVYSKSGRPYMKRYLDESRGVSLQSIWTDISMLRGIQSTGERSERLGYPTQKPVALLERIVQASSNEGDVVLDPFCGCGTTVHAAEKLGRQWIGIDVTHLAINLIKRRLTDAFGENLAPYQLHGVPTDLGGAKALAAQDKHEFEKWAITLIPNAQPYKGGKKGADQGIDGILWVQGQGKQTDKCIIEVKGGSIGDAQIRSLIGAMERAGAPMGIFLTLREPTKPMKATAAAAGFWETDWGQIPRVQIVTVEQLLTSPVPPVHLPMARSDTYKKAAREERDTQGKLDL